MGNPPNYVRRFNREIRSFFTDALRLSAHDRHMALFLAQALCRQTRATRVRAAWERRGVHVPPFIIASITKRCNLQCAGCYARAQHRAAEPEMDAATLRRVIGEARDLGVSIMLIAGGEPLTRPEILDITRDHPEIIFPLFTNGLLIDDAVADKLACQRNVAPVLSMEGYSADTDGRRGMGVYEHVQDAMRRLRERKIFFGTSLTVTSQNLELVTDPEFVRGLMAKGCRLFFFVDYVPVQPGTEALVLSPEQREREAARVATLRRDLPGLFVAFPGDEEAYGGCLAAGRGFVHISPQGRLEPCPFSPYSDASLQSMPLRLALQSRLLATIRSSEGELRETRGGCALWERREWVQALTQAA